MPPCDDERSGLVDDPFLADVPEILGYPVLGQCVLYEFIDEGGMGRVYRAWNLTLGLDAAVKFIRFEPGSSGHDTWSRELVERYEREVQVGAKFNSPHLVNVRMADSLGALWYFEMEWIEGETALDRLARQQRLPPEDALAIARGVGKALQSLHAGGVVHRDVKPQNVMVTDAGVVKLADLGLVRQLSDAERGLTRAGMGTPGYLPPEQAKDARLAGPPADVFALGASLFHLLSGEYPHRSFLESDLFPSLGERMPDLPAPLIAFVDRCTQREPGDRFADGAEFLSGLDAVVREIDLELPERLADSRSRVGRHRALRPAEPLLGQIAEERQRRKGAELERREKVEVAPELEADGGSKPLKTKISAPSSRVAVWWATVSIVSVAVLAIAFWPEPGGSSADPGGDAVARHEATGGHEEPKSTQVEQVPGTSRPSARESEDLETPPVTPGKDEPGAREEVGVEQRADPIEASTQRADGARQRRDDQPPTLLAARAFSAGVALGEQSGSVTTPAVDFDRTAGVSLEFDLSEPVEELSVRRSSSPEALSLVVDGTTAKTGELQLPVGRHTFVLSGQDAAGNRLTETRNLLVVVPAKQPALGDPDVVQRVRVRRAVGPQVVYEVRRESLPPGEESIAEPGLDSLRFVPVEGAGLVMETELCEAHFAVFLNDRAGFTKHASAWHGLTLVDGGVEGLRARLVSYCRRSRARGQSGLPMTGLRTRLYFAYASWLRELTGLDVRVPRYDELLNIHARNFGLPAGAALDLATDVGRQAIEQAVLDRSPLAGVYGGAPQGLFGLRHALGNAAEMCLDDDSPAEPLDGEVTPLSGRVLGSSRFTSRRDAGIRFGSDGGGWARSHQLGEDQAVRLVVRVPE